MARRGGEYGYVAMINGDDFDIIVEVQKRLVEALGWEGDFLNAPRNWAE